MQKRGTRTLRLNGTELTVTIRFNEIAAADRAMARSTWQIAEAAATDGRPVDHFELRELFYQGVKPQAGILTAEDAGDWLYEHCKTPQDVTAVAEAIFGAIGDSYPMVEDEAKKN